MIDTHTHLNFQAFENDWQAVVDRAIDTGVGSMIVVGTDVVSSRKAIEMASAHPSLFASVGVHPHHAKGIVEQSKAVKSEIMQIRSLLKHPRVVAVGEVGLDYHIYQYSRYSQPYNNDESNTLTTLQKELFIAQVQLAVEFHKPLIIHSRDAKEEVLDLLLSEVPSLGSDPRGVFHCFEGSKKYLLRILDAGFFVSFTGNITYSEDREKVASLVPLNKLLLETDSPFMTPMPLRGKRNEPSYVKIVAEKHALSRGVHFNEVLKHTQENALELFHL